MKVRPEQPQQQVPPAVQDAGRSVIVGVHAQYGGAGVEAVVSQKHAEFVLRPVEAHVALETPPDGSCENCGYGYMVNGVGPSCGG